MHILVDGDPILRRTTGVGRYTRELLWAALGRSSHHYTAFGIGLRPPAVEPLVHPNLEFHHIRAVPSRLYNALMRDVGTAPPVDVLARVRRPDLAFFPNYVVYPIRARVPTVVVVYDLSFRRYPATLTIRSRRFLNRWVPKSLQRADVVVAISEFTRQEILSTYDIDPEKVIVVPCAIDPDVFRPAESSAVDASLRAYDLPRGYVLTVGTLEPRKNLLGLVRAYRLLPADVKKEHPLVIVGGKGWRDSEIVRELSAYEAAGEPILRTGYVDDAMLPALYSGAAMFAYPSLYEGFGLPVLEAMACGAPVLTSNTASLPEVTAGTAVLVDPSAPDVIASALMDVLASSERRAALSEAGVRRAREYSWATSADVLLQVFDRLAG
jgi:glycosyltransferase involved in cell wall biosynthesis